MYVPVVEVRHHFYLHVGYGLLAKLVAWIHLPARLSRFLRSLEARVGLF